jgi:hypothetical protein
MALSPLLLSWHHSRVLERCLDMGFSSPGGQSVTIPKSPSEPHRNTRVPGSSGLKPIGRESLRKWSNRRGQTAGAIARQGKLIGQSGARAIEIDPRSEPRQASVGAEGRLCSTPVRSPPATRSTSTSSGSRTTRSTTPTSCRRPTRLQLRSWRAWRAPWAVALRGSPHSASRRA